jgi:hypothetical protein
MKPKYLYSYISFILLICMADMCVFGKRKKLVEPTYLMSQEFKDYTLFKEKSQWIYQEVNNNWLDTLEIIKQEIKTYDIKIPDGIFESFKQTLKSSFFPDVTDDLISSGTTEFLAYPANACAYSEVYYSKIHALNTQFFSDKNLGTVFNLTGGQKYTTYKEYFETYTLGKLTFQKVKVFEMNFEEDNRLSRKVYYAKNVGLIRKELWNGQVWNLVDYKVSQ